MQVCFSIVPASSNLSDVSMQKLLVSALLASTQALHVAVD
jgi:hypothetical protein